MNLKAVISVFGVFLGCGSSIVFLEHLIKYDPGAGNLITFSQFLFIALEGFIFTSKCGKIKPRIGLKDYTVLVVMFFTTNLLTNYAFHFNIPMPLHLIFRAGSLIANMTMNILILKRTYSKSKYISVFMITSGIVICTLISGFDMQNSQSSIDSSANIYSEFFWWTIGIILLIVALLVSAIMGIYQETLYKKHGKFPHEALFYTHLLPLPGFLLINKNIWEHFLVTIESESITIPIFKLTIPIMLFYLIANVLTQYVCISSVYVLTTECTSLTVTLVLTLRKFVSLIFSILYFSNPFTIFHWIGTLFVFFGTIIFAEIIPKIRFAVVGSNKEQKSKIE